VMYYRPFVAALNSYASIIHTVHLSSLHDCCLPSTW